MQCGEGGGGRGVVQHGMSALYLCAEQTWQAPSLGNLDCSSEPHLVHVRRTSYDSHLTCAPNMVIMRPDFEEAQSTNWFGLGPVMIVGFGNRAC